MHVYPSVIVKLLTLELRGGAHHLITTQVSRMKAALFAVPSSDLLDGVFESR